MNLSISIVPIIYFCCVSGPSVIGVIFCHCLSFVSGQYQDSLIFCQLNLLCDVSLCTDPTLPPTQTLFREWGVRPQSKLHQVSFHFVFTYKTSLEEQIFLTWYCFQNGNLLFCFGILLAQCWCLFMWALLSTHRSLSCLRLTCCILHLMRDTCSFLQLIFPFMCVFIPIPLDVSHLFVHVFHPLTTKLVPLPHDCIPFMYCCIRVADSIPWFY